MTKSLDHICLLVKNIDRAIEHYATILGETAPDIAKQRPEKQERHAGKDHYLTAVFVAKGEGCNIQLLQPLNPESPLYKRLEKNGEHVHHIAFTSKDLPDGFQRLKSKGVPFNSDQFVTDAENPAGGRWTWILPAYAHGTLIEFMDEPKKK